MGIIFLFIIAASVILVGTLPGSGPYPYGRVPVDEWTKYDDEGNPVCGMGFRGYWTRDISVGDWPFDSCACGRACSGWKEISTGKHARVISLAEALRENDIDIS